MSGDQILIEDKARLVAEAKFLRAYVYLMLVIRFDGVPIVTQSYNLGDDVTFTRSSFEECVEFIDGDLTEAMTDLPDRYESTNVDFGRATDDACKALRSRLFLYAAS